MSHAFCSFSESQRLSFISIVELKVKLVNAVVIGPHLDFYQSWLMDPSINERIGKENDLTLFEVARHHVRAIRAGISFANKSISWLQF